MNPPSKKRIALLGGPLGFRGNFAAWGYGLSLKRLEVLLREAGHEVELIMSPDEETTINILNNYDLVGILGHGPPDYTDRRRRPIAGVDLGGTSSHECDYFTSIEDRDIRGDVPESWVTANELDGRIDNPDLEVVFAACNSAKTSRLSEALGTTAAFIGLADAYNFGTSRSALNYIVLRANGETISSAKDIISENNKLRVDPTNKEFPSPFGF